MNSNVNYRDYRLNLLAGVEQSIALDGEYWQIIAAASAVMIRFDEQVFITRYQGMGGPANYRQVNVMSDVDQVVTLALGRIDGGAPYDGRASLAGVNVSSISNIGNTLTNGVDTVVNAGTQVQMVSANVLRGELALQLDDAAPGAIRYGDSTVSAIKGMKLQPGDTAILTSRASVYVYNPNATAATVRVMEGLQ